MLFSDLRACLERHYRRSNRRSWDRAEDALNRLEEFLGTDTTALDITKRRMLDYVDHRLAAGAAPNTVRSEVGIMSKAFGAAIDEELLAVRPVFKKPPPGDPREGFYTEGDMAALLGEPPPLVRPVTRSGHMTGWRLGEWTGLTWDRVDWERQATRLSRSQTKGKDARYFPFAMVPGLKELLEEQWRTREGNFVFHNEHARNDGGRILTEGSFYTAWRAACRKAGLAGRTFHDLRRTAAIELLRAGVRS